jgi:2'-5' RNA ligase
MELDLKNLYKTLIWHKQEEINPTHDSCGLFIQVPEYIARQFPSIGKDGHDSSPPHITLLYIGQLPQAFEPRLFEVVQKVCENFKCFEVKLGKLNKFVNEEKKEIVYHSPIISKRLQLLHEMMKIEFQHAQLPYSTKFPEFKPHITIEYVNFGDMRKLPHVNPVGSWLVDSVWVWGTSEPKLYFLK